MSNYETHILHTHTNVSEFFNIPEIITNPEVYFGPNYKTLLNFWIYWNSLSFDQRVLYKRNVIKCNYVYKDDLLNLIAFYVETKLTRQQLEFLSEIDLEIIASHIIIQPQIGIPLTFIPLLESL